MLQTTGNVFATSHKAQVLDLHSVVPAFVRVADPASTWQKDHFQAVLHSTINMHQIREPRAW